MAYVSGLVPAPPAGGQELFLTWDRANKRPDWIEANGTDLFLSKDGWETGSNDKRFLRADGWTNMDLTSIPATQEEFDALTWYEIEKLAKDCAAKAESGIDGGYSSLLGSYKEDTCGGQLNGFRLVDVVTPDAWDRYPYKAGYAGFVFETVSCYNNVGVASGLASGAAGHVSPYANATKFHEALAEVYDAMPDDMRAVIKEVGIPCGATSHHYNSKKPFTDEDLETDYYKLWFPSYSNMYGRTTDETKNPYYVAMEGEGEQFAYYRDEGVTTTDTAYPILKKAASSTISTFRDYWLRTPRTTSSTSTATVTFSEVGNDGKKTYAASITAKVGFAFCFAI